MTVAVASKSEAESLSQAVIAGRQGRASFGELARAYVLAEKLGLEATMVELRGLMTAPGPSSYLLPAMLGLATAAATHVALRYVYGRGEKSRGEKR